MRHMFMRTGGEPLNQAAFTSTDRKFAKKLFLFLIKKAIAVMDTCSKKLSNLGILADQAEEGALEGGSE